RIAEEVDIGLGALAAALPRHGAAGPARRLPVAFEGERLAPHHGQRLDLAALPDLLHPIADHPVEQSLRHDSAQHLPPPRATIRSIRLPRWAGVGGTRKVLGEGCVRLAVSPPGRQRPPYTSASRAASSASSRGAGLLVTMSE